MDGCFVGSSEAAESIAEAMGVVIEVVDILKVAVVGRLEIRSYEKKRVGGVGQQLIGR